MPFLSPGFREVNYYRMRKLKEAGLTDRTIAQTINELNRQQQPEAEDCTEADVKGYLKMTAAASTRMLVTQKVFDALADGESEPDEPCAAA